MQSKRLLIVFAKNPVLGKVKTRLAESIGDENAFRVYQELLSHTEEVTSTLSNCDIHIYYSDTIEASRWNKSEYFVQNGSDLGERMMDAFKREFDKGYTEIIGIGTDLPDLDGKLLIEAFQSLDQNDVVFGPTKDGGYYLIGMTELHTCVFENKPWSTSTLLQDTLQELNENNIRYKLLETLDDIDTVEDLKNSSFAERFKSFFS